MLTKTLRTAVLAFFTLTIFHGRLYGVPAGFPAQGDDVTQSLGQFNIIVNPIFQPMMAGYPGYNSATKTLTSPLLYDPTTVIGRSSALPAGSSGDINGVAVGSGNINVSQSMLVVQPGGLEPAGTREVHTTVYSLNMVPFGAPGAAVRAGTNAPSQRVSPGEVESWSGAAGTPVTDFPAQSFFDIFVEVDIPAGDGSPHSRRHQDE